MKFTIDLFLLQIVVSNTGFISFIKFLIIKKFGIGKVEKLTQENQSDYFSNKWHLYKNI